MLVMGTTKRPAHPLGEFVRAQQSIELHDLALAMNPFRLDGVQPRTLFREKATDDPHPTAALLHFSVVFAEPWPHLPGDVPACVVPDKKQGLLANSFEALAAPREKPRAYGAHGPAVDEPYPHVLEPWKVEAVAGYGLGVGVVLGDRLLDHARGLALLGEGAQSGQRHPAPPAFVLKAYCPLGVGRSHLHQSVAPPFFRSYKGSGEVIHRLARCQRMPRRRQSVARMVSPETLFSVRPSSKAASAAISRVHRLLSYPNSLGRAVEHPPQPLGRVRVEGGMHALWSRGASDERIQALLVEGADGVANRLGGAPETLGYLGRRAAAGAGEQYLAAAHHEGLPGAQPRFEAFALLFRQFPDKYWRFHKRNYSPSHTTLSEDALGFPNDEDRRRSLKDVAADFIGAELDKEEQTSDFGLEDLTDAQVCYSLHDAEILIPLKDAMMERLRDLGLEKVAELEARFLPALAYCENNGFALDTVGWREQALRAKAEAERLWAHCDALSPPGPNRKGQKGWNWRSAKQIGEVFKLLGVSLPKTDKGNDKTDESTLKGVTSPEKAVSLAETLLRLREQNKRASWGREWLDLPKWKGKRFDKDHQFVVNGRVHASFGQVIKTGRMRCSKPNLQGLPPEFRRYFAAPPGRKLIVADYKNIELVLAGVVAGEDNLLEAFRRGEDVHSLTARGMLESDPKRAGRLATHEEIKEFRPVAKLVSFSILYGSGAKGLAEGMTNRVGVPTTKEEAQVLMGNFFQAYPRLKSWYVKEHAKAKAGDERSRTLTGRMRLLDKEYRYGRWCVKPQLRLNSPIQGSACDGLKYAAAIAWERRRECPGDPKLVNLVHDEIVLEIDEEHAEVGKVWLERCMLDGMAEVAGADVPTSVEIEIADSW